jgi:hypothetical protein
MERIVNILSKKSNINLSNLTKIVVILAQLIIFIR